MRDPSPWDVLRAHSKRPAMVEGSLGSREGKDRDETSKAAIVQFTRAVAVDWAPHGINVNVICPGGFMTEPNVRWSQSHPDVIEKFKQQIPLGDYGDPEDLGPLAVYLASNAARYITGASFIIDGGYTLI